ncbi:MAG: BolA/IbaG family iron-sulfur metabolism protein [Gammaproteobacteria bacterium]|nr:BolA/IbaG family iron-sulfur metabolism protein [Gammaproteobacteria bacterium]
MQIDAVKTLIQQAISDAQITVEGEGCSFSVQVVSATFDDMSLVQRQRAVMGAVKAQLASGELHAISVSAMTPQEAQQQR